MRLYPLLLQPRVKTALNRWKRRSQYRAEMLRNAFLLLMTIGVMVAAYLGGMWVLEHTKTEIDFAYFHSSMVLGLILFFLMSLLLLTNSVAALSALYLSRDLSLLTTAPMSTWRFFWGKFSEVFLASSWMTALFLLPVLLVFGRFYHADWQYWVLCVVTLIPYFVIPTALAMLCSTLFAVFVPLTRKREIFLLLLAIALSCLYALAKTISFGLEDNERIDLVDILKLVSMLSFANRNWLPSYWVAGLLSECLEPTKQPWSLYLSLLYSTTIAALAGAFLSIRLLHFRGYSRQGLGLQGSRVHSAKSQKFWGKMFGFLNPPARALVVKELKTSSRDMTQSVNILILFGLFAMYLYMLSFQNLFQQIFPGDAQRRWKMILLIINICLEAFVITSMGTRLVFPSVSRESRAYWVVQTAPLSIERLLKVKFAFWFSAVFILTSLFFGLAAYLAYGSWTIIAVKTTLNALLCFALVGMGIGLGAYFADFEWEHPSQLTTGFGSLVYMLSGVALIGLTLLLASFTLWFGIIIPKLGFYNIKAIIVSVGCGVAIPLCTISAGIWSLRIGARALTSRSS